MSSLGSITIIHVDQALRTKGKQISIGLNSGLHNPFQIGEPDVDGHTITNDMDILCAYDIWLEDQIKAANQAVLTALEKIGQCVLAGEDVVLVSDRLPTHGYIIKRTIMDAIHGTNSR